MNNNEEGWENPYKVKALVHIVRGEEIPDELLKKMQEFDEKHIQEQKKSPYKDKSCW